MAGKRKVQLESSYSSASGSSLDEACFLGQRYDAERGFKPYEAECWILRNTAHGDELTQTLHFGTTGWLTRLWRSPMGQVFVSSATDAQILHHPDPAGDVKREFEPLKLGVPLTGVWGLSDGFVLAWGAKFDGSRHLFRYDGNKWKEMKAPDFEVRAIHGLEEDVRRGGSSACSSAWARRTSSSAWCPTCGPWTLMHGGTSSSRAGT